MEIKTTKVDLNVLEATEGHYIYKKSDDIKEAYFTKKVYLGVSDSADNYAEITDSEYDKEMKRREDEQNTAQEETESVLAE